MVAQGFAAIKKRLASGALKKAWGAAKKAPAKSGPVPNGQYILALTGMEIKVSQNGNLGLNSEWTVVDGEEGAAGRKVFIWHGLENETSLPFVCGYLETLGVDLDEIDLGDLDDVRKTLLKEKLYARGRVTTRGEFTNLDIETLVDPEDYTVEGDESEDEENEEVEFEVGMRVSVEDSGEMFAGEIKKVLDGKCSIKFDAGTTETWDNDEISVLDADDDETEEEETEDDDESESETEEEEVEGDPDVNDKVTWKVNGKKLTGKVTLSNPKKKTCNVRVGDRVHSGVAWSKLTILTD